MRKMSGGFIVTTPTHSPTLHPLPWSVYCDSYYETDGDDGAPTIWIMDAAASNVACFAGPAFHANSSVASLQWSSFWITARAWLHIVACVNACADIPTEELEGKRFDGPYSSYLPHEARGRECYLLKDLDHAE